MIPKMCYIDMQKRKGEKRRGKTAENKHDTGEVKRLLSLYHTDADTGFKYRYIHSRTEYFVEHRHDFYEVFLVTGGNLLHTCNGETTCLGSGALCFIRPEDRHVYAYDYVHEFTFANLAFTKENAEKLFSYLEDACDIPALLHSEYPPAVTIPAPETERLLMSMQNIYAVSGYDTAEKLLRMRTVLFEVFSRYFSKYRARENELPAWLDYLCESLGRPECFARKKVDMSALCGKTKEHISRSFRKYLGVTPSEYLAEIRLNYAENLLKNTNLSVLEVSMEAGFDNLSWFHRLFRERFGTSPKKYRERS